MSRAPLFKSVKAKRTQPLIACCIICSSIDILAEQDLEAHAKRIKKPTKKPQYTVNSKQYCYSIAANSRDSPGTSASNYQSKAQPSVSLCTATAAKIIGTIDSNSNLTP